MYAVTASGPRNAWVAGINNYDQPDALHCNGTTWNRTTVPRFHGGGELQSIATTASGRAWAVGLAGTNLAQAITDTWNGHAWHSHTWK